MSKDERKDKPASILVNDPEREKEKKRLYSSNRPGTPNDERFYAVARGKVIGVVKGWTRAQAHVTGCKKPVCYQAFNDEKAAWEWLTNTRHALQRKLHRRRTVTKTRPVKGGKSGEEEEYLTEEEFTDYEDTSEEEQAKGGAPRKAPPPPPPKKIDQSNVDTQWMGSQRYVTDKVWLVEEEARQEEEKKIDVVVDATPVAQKYAVGPILGRGTFALVKEAKDKKTQQIVALKLLSADVAPTFTQAVAAEELRILKSVQHQNVVQLIESFALPHAFVFVLEKCDTELLNHLLSLKQYTEEDAQTFVRQLLDAVEVLHSKNIVHRDLVPENLLVKGKTLKVAGFSMATECPSSKPFDGLLGTPSLQPPETAARQNFSKALDLWSVGVLTYVLLSGKFPFQDTNVIRLTMKIRKGEFEFLDNDFKGVSAEAKGFVKRLLQVDVNTRATVQQAKTDAWFKSGKKNPLPNFLSNLKQTVESHSWY